jgi:transposase
MRRPRRNHTAAFKAKVAVAALKGDKTLEELTEKFDVHRAKSRNVRRRY